MPDYDIAATGKSRFPPDAAHGETLLPIDCFSDDRKMFHHIENLTIVAATYRLAPTRADFNQSETIGQAGERGNGLRNDLLLGGRK